MFRHWFLALTREIRKPRSHQKHVPLNLTVLANRPGTLVGSLNLHLGQHSVLSKAKHMNPKVLLLLLDQLVRTYFVLCILPSTPVRKHLDWLKSDALLSKKKTLPSTQESLSQDRSESFCL